MLDFLQNCWATLEQLAPWLWFGMLLSGLMHILLPKDFIRRRFQGTRGVVKAVAFGIPLPLCSCGVVPAGIGLKNDGASNGAALGFLISTPQTGVDSVLVSVSFFGWPFAIFKMVSAFILGILGGLWADRLSLATTSNGDSPDCCSSHSNSGNTKRNLAVLAWNHSIEILRSIWIWLVVGIIVSSLITQYVPNTWLASIGAAGLIPAMLLALLVSAPLYVCATASLPIAAALISQGLPPAAALVFLMAGPATNLTTMGAIYGRFGWRFLAIYLTTIILGSMLAAFAFDWMFPVEALVHDNYHGHHHQNWFSTLCSAGLIGLFAYFIAEPYFIGNQANSNMGTPRNFQVRGMKCGSCVAKVTKSILSVDGINSVEIDLDAGRATLTGDFESDEIASVLNSIGYSLVDPSLDQTDQAAIR